MTLCPRTQLCSFSVASAPRQRPSDVSLLQMKSANSFNFSKSNLSF
jgi:hypothetical protein